MELFMELHFFLNKKQNEKKGEKNHTQPHMHTLNIQRRRDNLLYKPTDRQSPFA